MVILIDASKCLFCFKNSVNVCKLNNDVMPKLFSYDLMCKIVADLNIKTLVDVTPKQFVIRINYFLLSIFLF